jgi:putative transposase
VITMVQQIRKRQPRLGTPKVYKKIKPELIEQSIKMGRDKLHNLLSEERMLVGRKKNYTRTTNSYHRFRKWPNLIKDKVIDAPEQVWVSDITYINTSKGYMYLFLITDAYSKQIMGYHLSDSMKVEDGIKALRIALLNRRYPERKLIHHSDRGLQYSHPRYIEILEKNGIAPSMTTKYDPYENAVAERVNGILKGEYDVGGTYPSREMAKREVKAAIQIYNQERPHLSCQMMTPWDAHRYGKYELKSWKKRFLSCGIPQDKN